jgi:hypothetical protein
MRARGEVMDMASQLDHRPAIFEVPKPTEPTERSTAGGERLLFAAVSVGAIWISVLLASLFSKDMITGSQQEHLPIAALLDWLWAAAATGALLVAFRKTADAGRAVWLGMTIAVSAVWLAVALVSIFSPRWITGTDPTQLPIAAIVAPAAGMFATKFIATFVADLEPR